VTTILDVALEAERSTGTKVFTPRWEATARAFYGLELREQDAELLAASTRRSKDGWLAEGTAAGPNRRQRRELWARVGRRGRKSFTMAFIAVFEAIYGGHEHYLVPGEQGLIAIISKDVAGSRREAARLAFGCVAGPRHQRGATLLACRSQDDDAGDLR
jgi:hypothetical protein